MVPVEMRIMVMDIMVAMMVNVVVAVVVMMAAPEVNAYSAATKMNADSVSIMMIIVMIVMVLCAHKRGWPDCRQDNRHNPQLIDHWIVPPG
jgi:hypothetical protein